MQETWVRSLDQEDPLEKEMATHSSILAWKIPWMEEPGGLQSMGSQRVRHDWATSLKGRTKTTYKVPEMVQSQMVASNKVVTLETESAILGHGLGVGMRNRMSQPPPPSPRPVFSGGQVRRWLWVEMVNRKKETSPIRFDHVMSIVRNQIEVLIVGQICFWLHFKTAKLP